MHPINVLWEFDITVGGSADLIFDGSTALRTMPPMQLSGLRVTNTSLNGTVFVGTNGVDALTTAHYWKALGPQDTLSGVESLMGRGAIAQFALIGDGTGSMVCHVEVLQ